MSDFKDGRYASYAGTQEHVYKLVAVVNGRRESCAGVARGMRGFFRCSDDYMYNSGRYVVYEPGRATFPKSFCGYLAAWDNPHAAFEFAFVNMQRGILRGDRWELWQCLSKTVPLSSPFTNDGAKCLWDSARYVVPKDLLPDGTALCEWIKPIRLVGRGKAHEDALKWEQWP